MSDALVEWLEENKITEVECLISDMAGIPRGKILPVAKYIAGLKSGGPRLPEYVFGQTVMGDYEDSEILQARVGDVILRPDVDSAFLVPWYKEPTAQIIHDAYYPDGRLVDVASRSVLKNVLKLFQEADLVPVIAPELEFFLVVQNSDPNYPLQTPPGRSGRAEKAKQAYGIDAVNEFDPFFEEVYDHCEAMGLDIDTLTHEGGAGQMEINFNHGDALALADQAFLFKRTVRQTALNHGIHATFMAKPMQYQPGSSMHLHCSLIDKKNGKNIFAGPDGEEAEPFFHAIGGLQTYLPTGMALMAPFVNSYRRLSLTYDAPRNVAWGYDNRTVGLRVPMGTSKNKRVENRIPGADANPYLAIAVTLACVWLGLQEEKAASKPVTKEQDKLFTLPRNLDAALDKLEKAKPLQDVLGERFIALFGEVKRAEAEAFLDVISPWEREYLLLNV